MDLYHGESDHVRDEVVRQHIEDYDADAGVGDMLNDYHEAHFLLRSTGMIISTCVIVMMRLMI